MNKFLAKQYFAIGVVVFIVLAGGMYWYVKTSGAPSFAAFMVGRGNVVESVDEPGNIIAENNVALSFQQNGQIAAVYAKEGESVSAGAALAALDESSLKAALEQANAALAAARAELDGLTTGTRPEQLQIDETAVVNAQASLGAVLQSAYASADDAVRNQVDNMFSSPENSPIFLVPVSDSQAAVNIQYERQIISSTLKNWYAAASAMNSGALSAVAKTADDALRQVGNYLNTVALSVNQAVSSNVLPSATLSGYKLNVATARTEVIGAASALATAKTALANAENALALDRAGATPQAIEAQKAAVAQAQAAASSAEVALARAVLTAPFGGTVQNLTAKAGQVATLGAPVLSLVNNGGLKIEVYVSQADIAKIKEGEKANATVDAYGTGTVFPATVTAVGVTETAANGAPAYKVTLHFANADERLKDGMTANVHIIVAEHDNALEVPSRLVIADNSRRFVLMKNGGATERREIQTGIAGNDGMTEIISGLNAGDRIVNF